MGIGRLLKPKLVIFVPILIIYFFVSAIIMFYMWGVNWKSAPNAVYIIGGLGLATSLVLLALMVYITICVAVYCASKMLSK